jgi:hypothetical protein
MNVEDVVRFVASNSLLEGYFILVSGTNEQITYSMFVQRTRLSMPALGTAATILLLKIRRDIESKATFVFQTILEKRMQHIDLRNRSPIMLLLVDVAFFPFVYALPDTHLFMLDKVR